MSREAPEIDRLIEEGLTLYGQGNLDEALARWERALVIDPGNAQASSYVDYVRANYDLLTSDLGDSVGVANAPFGIADDEPEYQIEIQPGEIKPSDALPSSPESFDPHDEGWLFLDEETAQGGPVKTVKITDVTVELEAEEPPELSTPELPERPERPDAPEPVAPQRASSQPGVDFDAATREYDSQTLKGERLQSSPSPDEFGPDGTPGFGHPNDFQTPPGFGNQPTGVKQRDLGFVQPTAGKPPATTDLGLPSGPRPAPKASEPPPPPSDELTLEPETIARPKREDELHEELPTGQRSPLPQAQLVDEDDEDADDDDDLIASLPSPRPAPQVRQIAIETPLSGAKTKPPPTKNTTRDFPHQTRAPAVPAAKTKELTPAELAGAPSLGAANTQDFEVKTQERNRALDRTQDIPNMAQAARLAMSELGGNPLVSAPTRDLGLRDAPVPKRPAPTTKNPGEGTRADVVLPFDPIDARAAEIMDEVDDTAPAGAEAREDRTRRRITTLFEKAIQWTASDMERAVAAVDLALSEDPSSALAQKLIHRNRETIMGVFQAYLGDLQRTPQLARPLHELASAPISPRAAFLLSRIDGLLSIDEILDVCGMPRLEAYRYLCQLFLRGILR